MYLSKEGPPAFGTWFKTKEKSTATIEKYRREAGAAEGKAFPHNLRHLFARTFCGLEKDIRFGCEESVCRLRCVILRFLILETLAYCF